MPSIRYKLAALIAAAGVTPYVAQETEFGRNLMSGSIFGASISDASGQLAHGISADAETRDRGYAHHAHYEVERLREVNSGKYRYEGDIARQLGGMPADANAEPSLAGNQIRDLSEVIRFDITPDWVISRFSRVSTVLANLNLKGLRVPIVTGIHASDVAGTLTYYFDNSDRLQRLTIHGFTGDASRFSQLMTSRYGLTREAALEAGAYTKRWNGRPVHFMRLTHAPVVYSDAVHHKYTIFVELNQPNLAYGISEEARRIVESDHHTGRW